MKTNLLLFLFVFLTNVLVAQTPQIQLKRTVFEPPKTVNGFKVRWATLSKGKYQEVFTNDTIQQIGCIYFNQITGEVVGEVVVGDMIVASILGKTMTAIKGVDAASDALAAGGKAADAMEDAATALRTGERAAADAATHLDDTTKQR